jgi:uncharacterized membrane protein
MAGIGFDLDNLFNADTFTTDLAGYTAAGLVLSGAWVFGLLAMILLYLHSSSQLSAGDLSLLFTMITYSYAGAMLLTSVLSLPITRYIADCLHEGHLGAIGPTYAAACLLHLVGAVILGGVFYGCNPLPNHLRLFGVILLLACTQVWLSAMFIGILRSYLPVASSFFVGYFVSTIGAIWLGDRHGLAGYLVGFGIGLIFIAMVLTGLLLGMLPYPRRADFGFLRLLRVRPYLSLAGVCLAGATWVDKIVFWCSPEALTITPLLRSYMPYDVSFFVGYTTALPALTWLLLTVEVTFARNARMIYAGLGNRETREQIHNRKVVLAEDINASLKGLLLIQGTATVFALYYTPQLLDWLGLPDHMVHIVRYSIVGSTGIGLVQAHALYLLYFDLSEAAFATGALYLVGNLTLTLATLRTGYWSYGLGCMISAYLAAFLGAYLLNRNLPRLEYLVMRYYARLTLLKDVPRSRGSA